MVSYFMKIYLSFCCFTQKFYISISIKIIYIQYPQFTLRKYNNVRSQISSRMTSDLRQYSNKDKIHILEHIQFYIIYSTRNKNPLLFALS